MVHSNIELNLLNKTVKPHKLCIWMPLKAQENICDITQAMILDKSLIIRDSSHELITRITLYIRIKVPSPVVSLLSRLDCIYKQIFTCKVRSQ